MTVGDLSRDHHKNAEQSAQALLPLASCKLATGTLELGSTDARV